MYVILKTCHSKKEAEQLAKLKIREGYKTVIGSRFGGTHYDVYIVVESNNDKPPVKVQVIEDEAEYKRISAMENPDFLEVD